MILGIGDDAALLDLPKGADLVASVDTIVAGRHFLPGADPRAIGHRALAVNLSDMAAMGATPSWATLALTIPDADSRWLWSRADELALARSFWYRRRVAPFASRSPIRCSSISSVNG